jgi:ferredoxin-type protein NapG
MRHTVSQAMPPDDKPVDRRRFFREGIRELLRPLAQAVEPIEQAIRQLESLDGPNPRSQSKLPPGVWLRPPGALAPDKRFTDACSRCGECVKVCPAQCIRIDASKRKGNGAPYIDVDTMPCVVCDGLLCMSVCPTGALAPTALVDIDMGTAVWDEQLCVRSRGQTCTVCVDRCPLGTAAIELSENAIVVHPNGCIGCGICEYYCPTTPKSVVVIPRMARDA